jgi:cytochrome c556
MRHKPMLTIAVGALTLALLAMPAVQAQSRDPVALVEQRQARMKALGGAMKTLNAISKGNGTAPEAAKAAGTLAAAGRAMAGWWPRGTAVGVSDSEAAPKIWTDTPGFRKQLAAFRTASARMDVAARTGDAARVGAAMPALGGSCKSCHEGYRIED